MARDAVTFIRALGLDQVDLFGFSMGGMIAQVITQEEPQPVRKMILAGMQAPVHLCRIRRFGYHKSQKAIMSPREGCYAALPHRNVLYVQLAPEPRHRDQAM